MISYESPENAKSLSNLALRVPDKRSGFVRLHFSVSWRPHGLRATLCRLLGRGGSCVLPHHVLRPDFGSEPPDAEGKGTGRTPEAAVLVRQSQDTQDGDSNSAPGSRTGVGVRDDPRAEYKSRAFAPSHHVPASVLWVLPGHHPHRRACSRGKREKRPLYLSPHVTSGRTKTHRSRGQSGARPSPGTAASGGRSKGFWWHFGPPASTAP